MRSSFDCNFKNQQTDEESDSSAELDINDHSNRRKSRRSKDSDSEEDKPRTPLPWDSTLFEGKHTDEFLARGGIPRRRKQKYTRKSGRAKERQNEYMAFLQSVTMTTHLFHVMCLFFL